MALNLIQSGYDLEIDETTSENPPQFTRGGLCSVQLTDDTFDGLDKLVLLFASDDGRRHTPAVVELSKTDGMHYAGAFTRASMLHDGPVLVVLAGTTSTQTITSNAYRIMVGKSLDPEAGLLAEPATLADVIYDAVDKWITANGVESGATAEEAAQIQQNAEAVSDLKSDIDVIETTLYDEPLTDSSGNEGSSNTVFNWELGAIYVLDDNVLSYGNSDKRIRITQGEMVQLKNGDKLSLDGVDDTDSNTWLYNMTVYGTGESGTIYAIKNQSRSYTIPENGEYTISVRRKTETVLSSIEELSSKFIYTPSSQDKPEPSSGGLVGEVEQIRVDVLELKNRPAPEIPDAEQILKRLKTLDGYEKIEWEGKNLVASSDGATFTTSNTNVCTKAIAMAKGDKFSISDYNKATLTVAGNIGADNYEFKSNSSSDVYVSNPGEFYACAKLKSGVSMSRDELASLITVVRANDVDGEVQKLLSDYIEYRVPEFVHGVKGTKADFDLDSSTRYQDIIDWYDQLKACHSKSMSREQYGTSQTPSGFRATVDNNTYPMYAYTIAPMETSVHKIILSYGIHGNGPGGDAINGVVGLAYFVRHLLNGYMEHPVLAYIRKYCTVVIMPVLNPWGYQNNSRGNGRNIDLNRNFSVGFVPNITEPSIELAYFPDSTSGTPEPIVSGSEAFSESESIAIRDYITNNHSDALFMLEGHSRGEKKVDGSLLTTVTNRFLTFVSDTDDTLNDVLLDSAKRLTSKYGGTVNGGTSLEADGQCYRYFKDTLGFQAYENECFGCYDNNEKTHGAELTEIMCEDFVASTVIAVTRLLAELN